MKELSQLTGLSVGGVRWNLDKLADKGRLKRVVLIREAIGRL